MGEPSPGFKSVADVKMGRLRPTSGQFVDPLKRTCNEASLILAYIDSCHRPSELADRIHGLREFIISVIEVGRKSDAYTRPPVQEDMLLAEL